MKTWWNSESEWSEFEKHYVSILKNPLVFAFVVHKNDLPIGYIQYWFVEDDPDFKPHFGSDTVGVDQFIGIADLIGKGIGPEFIRVFTDQLLVDPKINLVIVDPDVRNLAAIRAYEKAGFVRSRILHSAGGQIQLLERKLGKRLGVESSK